MSLGIPGGSMILTPLMARMLYDAAGLRELRPRLRGNDTNLDRLLLEISRCALAGTVAEPGNDPRQSLASEEAEFMTVRQIAKASKRAERTVRHDILNGSLPATKTAGAWLIPTDAAATYIAARRRH